MRASGVRFVAAHHGDFAYCRHAGRAHAFPVGGDLVRHCWPDADVFDVGPWDPAVVDGNRAPPQRVPVPFDPRRMADVADTLIDRVILARAQLVIEVRRMVGAKPGEYPALELALRQIYDAYHAKALRKADLHSAIRAVEPDRNEPGAA